MAQQAATVTRIGRASVDAQLKRIEEYRQKGANMIYLCEPANLPPDHSLFVEEFWVNPDPRAGEIFEPSGAKGKFALHLKVLERMFAVAGGGWDLDKTGPVVSDRAYMSYRAIGWVTREHGAKIAWRGDADMDLDVLKEQLVEDYESKAKKENKDKGWVDYCVKRDFRAKRENRLKLVASDAKAVVIRKLLGVGGTYPKTAFNAPFVIVRCVDRDPVAIDLQRKAAALALVGVYGQPPALPAPAEDYTAPEVRTEMAEVAPEAEPAAPVSFDTADRAGKIAMIRAKAAEINYPLDVITRQQMDAGEVGILAPLEDHPEDGSGGLNGLWGYLNRYQAPPASGGYPEDDQIPF